MSVAAANNRIKIALATTGLICITGIAIMINAIATKYNNTPPRIPVSFFFAIILSSCSSERAKLFSAISFSAPSVPPSCNNSSGVTLYSPQRGNTLSRSGLDWPVSHFETVCLVTSSFSATSSCERPASLRSFVNLSGNLCDFC